MWGIASRMAWLSAWILPSTRIEPEPSASQMKWSGRDAIRPPGRRGAGSLKRPFHLRKVQKQRSLERDTIARMGGRKGDEESVAQSPPLPLWLKSLKALP